MSMYKAVALQDNKELEDFILSKAAKQFYARGEKERFDLFPFYSILVSTGINKNTDAFDPVELWRARHSPADKPVNIGHNQTRIIGHIIDNIVVGEDLKPIPEDTAEGDLPFKLHIITAAVLYRIWEDPAVQAEVNQIIDEVSKGSIFVSMECLFKNFSYLLTHASTKEQKIIDRNEKTVGLTKYLRQYKGPGKIHDYEVARLLRDITFSAVGIVKKPANPDSIISTSLDLFSDKALASDNERVYINIDSSIKNPEKNIMSENINVKETAEYKELQSSFASLQDQYNLLKKDHDFVHSRIAELKTELATAQTALTAKAAEKDEEKDKAMEDCEATITDLKATVSKLEAKVTDLETSKASLATANDAMNATIEEFKKASRHSDRAEAMMKVDSGLTREAALQAVAKFDELSDASFAGMVQMMGSYASKAPKEVTPETILAGAKAETDVPMGATAENEINKTTADIKNFLKQVHGKKGS